MQDQERRRVMEEALRHNLENTKSQPSMIERFKQARRTGEHDSGRVGKLTPEQAAELYGEQMPVEHDDPERAYGYPEQVQIGITTDRMETVGSALDSSSQEQAQREAPAEQVPANDVEIIDPRGRLPQAGSFGG